MDFNLLLADLRNAAQQYCQKISDKFAATVAYCEVACKTIDKLEGIDLYENKVIGLWIILGYIEEMYARLTGPVINHLCQKLFRHCARTVLNIQWQQLAEDSQSKQNFKNGLNAFHTKLSAHNNTRFSLILDLMETGWTHPTLGLVMAEEEDNEEEECLNYIKNEDPVILKIRVEIMIQENCEEFALNLCSWCLKHPALTNDLDIRQTQLMLLHKLNQQDRLQEECQKIPCHDGVRLISRLQQSGDNKSLCTELAQTFLIQDWIRPSDHCNSKDLLTLWIRHQYQADQDQEKFLSSVWAVAKLSRSTEQIGLIIDGLREECGDMFLQLYTDLCIFAINYDKSCLEKHMQEGDMDGLRARQQAMASTSEKLSQLYTTRNPKTAMYAAVTAFALNPNQASLAAVKSFYVNQSLSLVKDRGKDCCSNCVNNAGHCDHVVGKINPATYFEVERLLNMLRPYYLNPDHDWLSLGPACEKYLAEREAVTQNFSNEDLINHDSSSVSEGSIPELEGSPQVVGSQRTLLHQHLVRPVASTVAGYSDQITQVSKHLKPFTAVTSGAPPAVNKTQAQDATSSISGIEPTLQLSDAELGDKHTLIKHLLFSDLSMADMPDTNTINELLQQGNIDLMPEAFQEITIDNSGSVTGSGSDSQDMNVPIPGHMKHATQVSAADPLFTSLNLPTADTAAPTAPAQAPYPQHPLSAMQLTHPTQGKLVNHAIKTVQSPQTAKPGVKLVPTPATVTSHTVKSGTSSAHQAAGQLNSKLMTNSSHTAANVSQKPSPPKGSVGSAVFRITSGLLRVPAQAAVVPTQDQTVLLQNQTQSMPVQQVVSFQGGPVTTQSVSEAQYYASIGQTVPQQVVQQQVLNLIGTSAGTVTLPLQQQAQLTPNMMQTTLQVNPTSTVAQIAPSIAAQLSQPQMVDSQAQVSIAQTVPASSPVQKQIKSQPNSKPQHLGKPQLAGLVPGGRVQKLDVVKSTPSGVTANLQQMLKMGGKQTVTPQQGANNTVTYTSTCHPHVAKKSKALTYPVVKKKSEIKANNAVLTPSNLQPPTVPAESDSNVPFVLKSALSKPKPKPKSKATIFTNSMISSKLSSNTAFLGGNGDEKLTCVKPLLTSGSTVSNPELMPFAKAKQESPEVSKPLVDKDELIVKQSPTDPNYSAPDKPKKASKKLFNVFYQCKICKELVPTQEELRKHIQTVCRADEFQPFEINPELAEINKANKQSHLNPKLTIKSLEACKVFQCPVCKVYCVTDPEVLQHRTGCLKSRSRPRKKPDKPKPAEASAVPNLCSSESVSSTCESSAVSEIVLKEIVQSVEENLSGAPSQGPSQTPQVSQPTQVPPVASQIQKPASVVPSAPANPGPAPVQSHPVPALTASAAPETKPIDLASLDLTNTEDLKKFIEHFKQQEMMKEKAQPTVSKSSKKSKKVEVPKAVVSVMSGVVDDVEAAAADVPQAVTPAAAQASTVTLSAATTTIAASQPQTTPVISVTAAATATAEPKPNQGKPKLNKPKKIPNPKYKELVHNGNSFFKCFLCKQTFCRIDSLESHWPECYERNGPIRKPKKIEKPDSMPNVSEGPAPNASKPMPSTPVSLTVDTVTASPVQSASVSVANTALPCVNSAPASASLNVATANVGDGAPPTTSTAAPEESKTVTKVKSSTPKASPNKPKPPPVPIDGAELAKYEDAIQSVIDSAGSYVSESEAKKEEGGQSAEGSAETPKKKKKKKPKPPDTPGGASEASSLGGQENGLPEHQTQENRKESPALGADGVVKKKKKKKPKPADGENSEGALEPGSNPASKLKKSGSPVKKTKKLSAEVFDLQGQPAEKQSPKKRSKPIPKKKHVNVKQMLKDRLECILSGKKDQCDVRSDGISVPLSQRTKGRPKPQILSETKQVIIIVGLEWGCGCAPCGTLFRNHRNLIQHLVIKHLQPYSTKKAECTTCHLCQQSFPTFIAYLNHTPQHSEIILERMDALIEEKGETVIADVEKSPEKEDVEENYVPFPDIQEALNDMLKIRQQQTHSDDGLKLGADSVGDVNLLSPTSDPSSGFQQVALPASMSLDSLHEFLPDPSKENVDELAAFARMINDPISNTDIGGISEQESLISDGPKEANMQQLSSVPASSNHCVNMNIIEPMLVQNQRNQIPANPPTQTVCHLPVPDKSIQVENDISQVSESEKPTEFVSLSVKTDDDIRVSATECQVQNNVQTSSTQGNMYEVVQTATTDVQISNQDINQAHSVAEQVNEIHPSTATTEILTPVTATENTLEVFTQIRPAADKLDEPSSNIADPDEVCESVPKMDGTVIASTAPTKDEAILPLVTPVEINEVNQAALKSDTNDKEIPVSTTVESPVAPVATGEQVESSTSDKLTPETKELEYKTPTDNSEALQTSVEEEGKTEEGKEECKHEGNEQVNTSNETDQITDMLTEVPDSKDQQPDADIQTVAPTSNENPELVPDETVGVKHLRSHPKKLEQKEEEEDQAIQRPVDNNADCKTPVDDTKTVEDHMELTQNAEDKSDATEERSSDLKAIVKHLRSHPKKTELVMLNDNCGKGSKTTVAKDDNTTSKKKEKSNSESRRNMRRTPGSGASNDNAMNEDTKEEKPTSRRTRIGAKRAMMKEENGSQYERGYKLRKTIPAKQFYRSSLKMKARMSRSSILDVLHSNRKLRVMRSRGRHPVDGPVVKIAADQSEESKALIKKTAARAHSAKFVTRSASRNVEQESENKAAKCAQLPESPKKEQTVSMRTRATIKKNKFGLKSFDIRLNNMSAETVRRKSAELARASTQASPAANRRSSCDADVKPVTPTSRQDSSEEPSPRSNPTSPSFLDSFLSYLNTRKDAPGPVQRKKVPKKKKKSEQLSADFEQKPPPIVPTSIVASETPYSQQSVAMPLVDKVPERDSVEKTSDQNPEQTKNEDQPNEDVNMQQTVDHVIKEEIEVTESSSRSAESTVVTRDNMEESNEKSEGEEDQDGCEEKTEMSEDTPAGNDTSKSETEIEEDEVILVEEFSSRPGAAVNFSLSTVSEEKQVVDTRCESLNQIDCIENKTAKAMIADGPSTCTQISETLSGPSEDTKSATDKDAESKSNADCSKEVGSKEENIPLPHVCEENKAEGSGVSATSAVDNSTVSPAQIDDVAVNDPSKPNTEKSNETDDDDDDSQSKDDKLKGVKSLREKVKTEPFTWDVDDEEDLKLAERNERSLKALRQQVSIGPFTWDMEEDERSHAIAGLEQVQIPPVASCSVTRNTRSGRRRIVKLSTDSRDSMDSDKKETSIECEATLTTVTWNVEVDDNAVDDNVLTDSIVVAAPLSASVNSTELGSVPGVVGRAKVDGVNCIRVVPSNSFKRKQADNDSTEVSAKKAATAMSSEESAAVDKTDSDVAVPDNNFDNKSVSVTPASETDNRKVVKKSVPRTVSKESSAVKDSAKPDSSVILTRKAAKAAAVGQPLNKKPRTTTTSMGSHMPAMVRRSAKPIKYSSKYRSTRGNPPPRVQVIRVDPVLEGVTTRRTRHGSSERTVHTPVALETMQPSSGKASDHKWTINKRKNFAYQFSRARRDKKSH